MNIKPSRLVLRCYAEKVDDQWQAFCLDFTLAAQADSFEQARRKLGKMILAYVYDALAGTDRQNAGDLLTRRAPFMYWAKYYWYVFLCNIGSIHKEIRRLFKEPLPLPLRHPYNHA